MSTLTAAQHNVFKVAKEAPAVVIFLIFVSEIGFNWLYVNFLHGAFSVPGALTDNLIQPLFILSFLKIGFIILGVVFWIGKFSNRYLGLTMTNFRTGLLSTIFFWSLLQLTTIVISSFSPNGISFLAGVSQQNPLYPVSLFILFAFSKALFDEVIYRGLVLPQFHVKVQRFVKLPPSATISVAIVLSQAIYLIIQMPLISLADTAETNLTLTFISLFLLSVLNAVVYLRTRNIFIGVGIHALWFYPLFVVNTPVQQQYLLVAIALGLVAVWPMLPKHTRIKESWPTQNQRYR